MRETEAVGDARREMEICNACRYCEGFCAVFPAMELRREFAAADLSYLANLCHDCRGCYYACQYAPPHEWGINVPRSFAEVRAKATQEYAWPQPLARAVPAQRRGGVAGRPPLGIALVLLLTTMLAPRRTSFTRRTPVAAGSFYDGHPAVGDAGASGIVTFVFSLVALGDGRGEFLARCRDVERRSAAARCCVRGVGRADAAQSRRRRSRLQR